MKVEYFNEYSEKLGRNMEFKVFGHVGKPCIAFPTQNGRFYEYENNGIINSMEWYIEQGKIQVFCVDAIDSEAFSATWKNPKDRIEAQEAYYNYIVEEFVPRVYEINSGSSNNIVNGIMTYGISLGAMQAMIFATRRPDMFNACLALSGIYHIGFFIKDYQDELTFLNSPIDSLKHMPLDHPYIELYKQNRFIICVGQGPYEEECLNDTRTIDYEMHRLKIPAWCNYWGYDNPHDWPSWLEQTPHYLYHILD